MNFYFSNSIDKIESFLREGLEIIENLKRPNFIKPEMCRYFNQVLDEFDCHGTLDPKTPKSKEKAKTKKLYLAIAYMYRLGFFVEKLYGKIFTERDAVRRVCEILKKEDISMSYYSNCKKHATDKDYEEFCVLSEVEAELKKNKAIKL